MLEQYSDNNETAIRAKLESALRQAAVPTLPIVAQKLIEMCQSDQGDISDFAQVIRSDAGLASRLLRVANSAYYGLRHKATTLERAITTLGLKHVKAISLGFHLVSVIGQTDAGVFNMRVFWEQNLLRGAIASELAKIYCPSQSDEAFVVGLLQDCGIPFLVEAWGDTYITLLSECYACHASQAKLEKELFEVDHMDAAEMLVKEWRLPEILGRPISAHHRRGKAQPRYDELAQMCQIAYFVATLPVSNAHTLTEDSLALPEYCRTSFGMDRKDIKEMLKRAQGQFYTFAQLFANILPEKVDPVCLLSRANAVLSDMTGQTTFKMLDLEAELTRLRTNCGLLADSVEELTMESETDKLTGLPKRSLFERHMSVACNKVTAGEASLTIMFLDIDDFRQINNTYGHPVGDDVLSRIGQLLKTTFENSGLVARYGGDEFVVSLLGLGLQQAIDLGQAFLRRVSEVTFDVVEDSRTVSLNASCSIGMLFCEAGSEIDDVNTLVKAADEQMYRAKRTGKNKICFDFLAAPVVTEVNVP